MPATVGQNGRSQSLVEYLTSTVQAREPKGSISVQKYLHSAKVVLAQAHAYRVAKNEEQLYVMLLRFASLVIETIPKHPEFARRGVYIELERDLDKVYLPELGKLKAALSLKQFPAKGTRLQSGGRNGAVLFASSTASTMDFGVHTQNPPPPLPSVSNSIMDQIPGQMAQTGLAPPPQFGSSKYGSMKNTSSLGKYGLFGQGQAAEGLKPGQVSLEPPPNLYPNFEMPQPPRQDNKQVSSSLMDADPLVNPPGQMIVSPPMEIQLGPQEIEVQNVAPPSIGPPDPSQTCCVPAPEPPPQPQSISKPEPAPARRTDGLREMHISLEMMEVFMQQVEANTKRGIESCALLFGKLSGDTEVLSVTHLIFPPQKGTRDQVEMLKEEVLLEEALNMDLIQMGWIHTHPLFKCFLSSIDVHTTLGYQIQLEESVAIVMAPTDTSKKCGVFRLSSPGGMDLIWKCDRRGFHEHGRTHTGQPIYESSNHVYINPRLRVSVVDRRNG